MKIAPHTANRTPAWVQCNRFPLRFLCCLLFFGMTPGAWTQYPLTPAPSAALTGPTLGASMRNAAAATLAQAENVRRMADDWGRRANSGSYNVDQFQRDFGTLQIQSQMLRDQFNGLASLALQSGSPRANNAVAELDAGLNIIAELSDFLVNQFNAGSLNRQTITRTCTAFAAAMGEWQQEFRKNSSRMDLVF